MNVTGGAIAITTSGDKAHGVKSYSHTAVNTPGANTCSFTPPGSMVTSAGNPSTGGPGGRRQAITHLTA